MSMPQLPHFSPEINLSREDVINLLLFSIAYEEIGLGQLIQAEVKKLQTGLSQCNHVEDIVKLNTSVERTLRSVIKKEMLLQFKLEDVLAIPNDVEKEFV
jgi:hypothetical protein